MIYNWNNRYLHFEEFKHITRAALIQALTEAPSYENLKYLESPCFRLRYGYTHQVFQQEDSFLPGNNRSEDDGENLQHS